MPSSLPAALSCPDPSACPVLAAPPAGALLTTISRGTPLYRCHDSTWGYDEFNPGFGDARFSPFADAAGDVVPTMYAAETREAALLETVFHDVHHSAGRVIYDDVLREKLLVHLAVPAPLTVLDLRDDELQRLGVDRDAIASSSQEHYPCTRRLAVHVHGSGALPGVHGIVWHSRQAELSGRRAEVVVVFGDRYGIRRGSWLRNGPGSQNLWEGTGRQLVTELANELSATIVTG